MASKDKSVTLTADLEKKLNEVFDAVIEKTDRELVDDAGSLIMYETSSGVVSVGTTNPSMPKKEMLEALHDIAEAIKVHGVPAKARTLTKRSS